MPDGASVFNHFPRLGKTPELTGVRGPLHVVVYFGEVCGLPVYLPLQEPGAPPIVYRDVVIITGPGNFVLYLSDVDLTTFVP